ncbi:MULTISPECIES: ABC transporter permease [Anaerolinea]|uniref:Ribose ABC transporter permease protein n=1 Tax=Anaerolinea thermophila (strain DSM 14523 / JCM 11388 / NBRC 100420 / UNI-1) TaxID=926569 RepID=E8N1H3_ANATU|nr:MULTISPECIES: ABC transporter permease [Anaerolinea]BAJ62578.1 ribose ABC transporter permease protein [Anaerolinea thermophila UNI-1]
MSQVASRPVAFDRRAFFQRFGLVFSFLLLMIALSLLSERFLTPANLMNVLRQATINGIVSVGMTIVILTGGIDLSVGSVLALSVTVGASLMKQGTPVGLAVASALGIGTLLGVINGLMITRAKIPPFIATLGMLTVARGLTLLYTQGQPITGLPATFRWIGTGVVAGIPMPVILSLAVFALGWVFLSRTKYGAQIYLLGDNPTAARLAGVPVDRMTVLVYAISGFCAALAGLVLVARLDSAQPIIGQGYEFNAIAAVVVGGTSFSGGEGGLAGTLLGALLIETLNNGLNLLNVSPLWEQVVKGVVIALALLLYKVFSPPSK